MKGCLLSYRAHGLPTQPELFLKIPIMENEMESKSHLLMSSVSWHSEEVEVDAWGGSPNQRWLHKSLWRNVCQLSLMPGGDFHEH